MVLKFLDRFRRDARSPAPAFDAPRSVPGRVYAVGDVHGAAVLLDRMIERIAKECAADGVEAQLVMMGDYVDRGDDSRAVLEILGALGSVPRLEPVLLAGNHEEMLLDFVDGRPQARAWLSFGGLQTLLSYGVGGLAGLGAASPEEMAALGRALGDAMGDHLRVVRRLRPSHRAGNVFFAHAGADPRLDLAQQDRSALLWGASDFLRRPRRDGIWVVHGHYVFDTPLIAEGRIGIDTGAYVSQCLTAVRLEGGEARFLQETLR